MNRNKANANQFNNPFRQKPNKQNTWKTGEKFDPEASSDEDAATPWSDLKKHLLHNQRDKSKPTPSKEVLQQRDEEHRKFLITERKEKPKWEEFTDEEDEAKTKVEPLKKPKKKSKIENNRLQQKFERNKNAKLNNVERNHIKKVITHKILTKGRRTLDMALKDYQRRGVERFINKD